METYTVRDKHGNMLMTLVGKCAADTFNTLQGEWRTYTPKNGKRTVCFEITTDSVWVHEKPQSVYKIFLWAGTKIIKD